MVSFQYPANWILERTNEKAFPGEGVIITNSQLPGRIFLGIDPLDIRYQKMTQSDIDSHLQQIYPEQVLKPIVSHPRGYPT
jgi:hypothetical protein